MTLERREPLKRKKPMKRGSSQLKRAPIKKRSSKMSKVYVERRALVERVLREQPVCAWPDCTRRSTEVHEIKSRARSGSTEHAILCRQNCVGLCHEHHRRVTENPLEAEGMGLSVHSWAPCPCGLED